MSKKMTEREEAIRLANNVLEDTSRDPDDDLSMMSRQFLRARETIEKQEKALQAVDWNGKAEINLIHSNRDQVLRMHEEAVRRITNVMNALDKLNTHDVCWEDLKIIPKILEALSTFHPMNDSWPGWPEGSE